MDNFLNSVLSFIEKNPVLFSGIFASIIAIIGFFFRQIKSFITSFSKWAWRKLQWQGKDHGFEKNYLDWLIRENRYLGLLPAQIVARRWKDRKRSADLEKVYVNLPISTQSGDEHWTRTYGDGESTWRKRPWG